MIPKELTKLKRWILYQNYDRGNGKTGKMPLRLDGREASVSDPNDWSTFDDVTDHILDADGFGFVLTNSGYVGLDFDDCVENGQVGANVSEIVDQLGTWTEFSPSGEGLHSIVRADLANGFKPDGVVDCVIVNGYVTVTGNHLAGSEIRDGSEFLSSLGTRNKAPESRPESSFTDPARIDAARAAMLKVEIQNGETDGSGRLVKYARQAVRWGLSSDQAVGLIMQVLEDEPTPREWTEDEIVKRWEQAHRDVAFGEAWVSRSFSNYTKVGDMKIGRPMSGLIDDVRSRSPLRKVLGALITDEYEPTRYLERILGSHHLLELSYHRTDSARGFVWATNSEDEIDYSLTNTVGEF